MGFFKKNNSIFRYSCFDNSIFFNGRSGYNKPIDFKLIPDGDNNEVSRKNTLQPLKVRHLSNVKNDLEITLKFIFMSSKSENKETSAVVK